MDKRLRLMYTIAILLVALTLIVPLAALPFLPDTIPAHYNAAGEVDRWGSRYEVLIFPLFMAPYGAIWLGASRLTREFSSEKLMERLLAIGGIVQFALFDAMIVYFLYADLRQVEDLALLPLELDQLLCAVTGLGLIALGNYMPKLKKPGPAGLRTPWSVKNEAVWRKCQRFGGWAMAAAGVVSILAAWLTPGAWCWLWTALAVAAACTAGTVYSWYAAKAAPGP